MDLVGKKNSQTKNKFLYFLDKLLFKILEFSNKHKHKNELNAQTKTKNRVLIRFICFHHPHGLDRLSLLE